MKVSFTNTIEDLVELNMNAASSIENKRTKLLFIISIPLLVLFSFIYDYFYMHNSFSYWYIFELSFSILWVLFFPRLGDLSAKFFLTYRLRKTIFEPLTLELTEEGITKSSSSSTYKFKWDSIVNVITTDNHIFIGINQNEILNTFSSISF